MSRSNFYYGPLSNAHPIPHPQEIAVRRFPNPNSLYHVPVNDGYGSENTNSYQHPVYRDPAYQNINSHHDPVYHDYGNPNINSHHNPEHRGYGNHVPAGRDYGNHNQSGPGEQLTRKRPLQIENFDSLPELLSEKKRRGYPGYCDPNEMLGTKYVI